MKKTFVKQIEYKQDYSGVLNLLKRFFFFLLLIKFTLLMWNVFYSIKLGQTMPEARLGGNVGPWSN